MDKNPQRSAFVTTRGMFDAWVDAHNFTDYDKR